MFSVTLERDLQEIGELSARLERGTDVSAVALIQRLMLLIQKVSAWQWCIHGETLEFRKQVVKWLVSKKRYVLARRYALCGKGDQLCRHEKTGRAKVKPAGCGARFCPRCSRRAGRKHLSRVAGHLSSGPHGALWHVVLTQPGLREEGIGGARERFEQSWKRFYPTLRKCGLVAALATYHAKRSERWGWHYHCHLVMEFDETIDMDVAYERINAVWKRVTALEEGELEYKDVFARMVAAAGPALEGMAKNTQLEFWDEPTDAVEKVLHYVLRDVLQGVESWVEGMGGESDCFEFCEFMGSAKRHRSYGTWRKKCAGGAAEDADAREEAQEREAAPGAPKVMGVSEWIPVSSVDSALHELKSGSGVLALLVMQLLGCTNRSKGVLFRLRKVVKSLAA